MATGEMPWSLSTGFVSKVFFYLVSSIFMGFNLLVFNLSSSVLSKANY